MFPESLACGLLHIFCIQMPGRLLDYAASPLTPESSLHPSEPNAYFISALTFLNSSHSLLSGHHGMSLSQVLHTGFSTSEPFCSCSWELPHRNLCKSVSFSSLEHVITAQRGPARALDLISSSPTHSYPQMLLRSRRPYDI